MDAFLKTGKLGGSAASKPAASSSSSSKTQQSSSRRGPVPWVEKYRPKTVDDVAHQEEVVAVLKKSLSGADLPNLLFYGPPGTGKTSTILAAARDLFGADLYRQRVLELNASDERGIAVIREKVKTFAQATASGRRPDGTPCPPFKIIILDEADSMTRDAQSALRRTMEKEGRSTKFCLICNYISRIIEPLTSRCAKFRFKPLAKGILLERLTSIAESEKVRVTDEGMRALLETSEGDLRKAITTLQSCTRLKGGDGAVSGQDVYELSGVVPREWLDRLVEACASRSFERVQAFADEFACEGFSVAQLFLQLHARTIDDGGLSDGQKAAVCEALAVNEARLLDGANEYLQLMDLATVLMQPKAAG